MTIATRFPKSWAVPKFDIKDPSLVLYLPLWYPYSDMTGSTIYSYDKNRLTGTVTGAVWGSQGRDFNGTADTIETANTLTPTTAVTAEVWVKLDTLANTYKRFCETRYDTGFLLGTSTNQDMVSGDPARPFAFIVLNTFLEPLQTGVNLAKWHHIAGTWNSPDMTIYVDSILTGTGSVAGTLTANILGIAKDMVGASGFTDGIIGEVRIYNRALSAGEIRQNYQVTKWRYL